MIDDLAELPIAEADKLARENIERCRDEMGVWRVRRAGRVLQERRTSSVAEIAADMGVHPQVVYELLREARTALETWWGNLSDADRSLFLEHRDDYPLPADVVERLRATRQIIVGGKWEGQGGYDFMWPSHLQQFLTDKAGRE